jgi:protein SCO1/2
VGSPLRAGLAALALAGLLAGCGGTGPFAGEDGGGGGDLTGTRLDPPFEVADVALQGADGASYSLTADAEAPLTLVFFGYTNCPDICGQVMATLAGTMTRLSDADREQVDVVFVTTDPTRDDAATVEAYTERYDPTFRGLTGDLDDIVALGRSMGVGVETGEPIDHDGDGEPDGYDVTHGTHVLGVTPDDEAPVYWGQEVSQAQLAADVHQLLDEG